VFAVLRFLTGIGITGISLISLVLSKNTFKVYIQPGLTMLEIIQFSFHISTAAIEWVDTEHRSFVGVGGSLSWALGNMLLAGLAFLLRDWRTLLIVVTAPLSVAVLTWWLPESARWLLVNGRVETAQFYLDRCAKVNKRTKVSVNLEVSFRSTITPFRTIYQQSLTIFNLFSQTLVDDENQDKNYTYLDLVKTPKIRKISLITGIVWFGVASTYYGISLNISGFGLNLFLTHFIYAAIEVPAKLMVYCFLDFIGRRRCLSGSLLFNGTLLSISDLFLVRTVVAILGKGLSEAAFTTVMLFTSELYPTVIRQNGLGYANFLSRLGVSVAPLILLLDDVWTLLPQIILCSIAITAGLAALLLPETRGIRLPETIDDIEGPRLVEEELGLRRTSPAPYLFKM
uniref:Zmp:0000001102 n=1 Tax=Cynoglossus semilaevis TaxID=244447 RepID=A0A3P8UIW9_CYNSE